MAADWLAAVLPANQMPGVKIFLNLHGFKHGNLLVNQAPVRLSNMDFNMYTSLIMLTPGCNELKFEFPEDTLYFTFRGINCKH